MHGIQAWVGAAARARGDATGVRRTTRRRPADGRVRRPVGARRRGRGVRREGARCGRTRRCSTCTGELAAGARAELAGALSRARGLRRGGRRRGRRPRLRRRARCSSSRPARRSRSRPRTDAIVMLLGGEPVGPRYIEWNFVSSSKERIEQAKADWRAGRMKLPDARRREFIPLPPDPPPEAPPVS